jgi:hypothetical protein
MDLKKKYGLIGFPLHNSFSVNFFTQKFSQLGATHTYQNYPIANLDQLTSFLKNPENLSGFNVTKPYKEKVIPYLADFYKVNTYQEEKELGNPQLGVLLSGKKAVRFLNEIKNLVV